MSCEPKEHPDGTQKYYIYFISAPEDTRYMRTCFLDFAERLSHAQGKGEVDEKKAFEVAQALWGKWMLRRKKLENEGSPDEKPYTAGSAARC